MAYSKGKKLKDEGVWEEFGGARWLIGRAGSTEWLKAQEHFEKPFKKKIAKDTLSATAKRDINLKSLARSILLDWKDVEEDGKAIPYSEEIAVEMLKDDPELLEFIMDVALDNDNFKAEQAEKIVKKSSKPSTGE